VVGGHRKKGSLVISTRNLALGSVLAATVCFCGAAFFRVHASSPQKLAPSPSGYRLSKKLILGGEGGWDYLTFDSHRRRVFISRGTHTLVVDAMGKKVGDIPNTLGVHGIALAPELNRGFTSNGRSNSVTMFELNSLKTIREINAKGENPDAILYDSASRRVFTFNGRSHDASVINATTGEVIGNIPLDGKPEFAQADGAGHVFVNIEDKSELSEIDSNTLKVLNTWPLAPCEEPSGLAFDVAHKRLFAGCGNRMMAVVDADSGKVVTTIPIGDGVDANAFDPETGFVFASCGEGTLTVAHQDTPDKYTVVENVPTQKGARTMTLDPKTHAVYLVTAGFGPPPAPTAADPHPRPAILTDSFTLLIFTK
jgi:DNA-binding beta-propeller fold protein YncE